MRVVEAVMQAPRIVVVGAGMGGLVSAILLAARGLDVTLVDKADAAGGKVRAVLVGGREVDAGPTVLTMRPLLDLILGEAGLSLGGLVGLRKADLLARHAWSEQERLDLYADRARNEEAIGRFAGADAARGYRAFAIHAGAVHRTMDALFMQSSRPSPASMVKAAGLGGLRGLWQAAPFKSLWDLLGEYFQDPRLRQLFGRYATYCGSSPFLAPATLALIADVEQQGVWTVDGGMRAMAAALARAALAAGVSLRLGRAVARITVAAGRVDGIELDTGEHVRADAVIYCGDVAALCAGLLGKQARAAVPSDASEPRSLSALTWMCIAHPSGFPLAHHSVFFSRDYRAEFEALLQHRCVPVDPTVYICAQDRSDVGGTDVHDGERILIIVNAPADGGECVTRDEEWRSCRERMQQTLARCGLALRIETAARAGPAEHALLYPGTQGAIYGMASHGWMASFRRQGSRSAIPGLYLAGGSVHPGAGVPMAALSGRAAVHAVTADLASTRRSYRGATPGGTSMP